MEIINYCECKNCIHNEVCFWKVSQANLIRTISKAVKEESQSELDEYPFGVSLGCKYYGSTLAENYSIEEINEAINKMRGAV